MQVEEDKAAATAEHEGKQYYFCSKGCQETFTGNPKLYIQDPDEKGHSHS